MYFIYRVQPTSTCLSLTLFGYLTSSSPDLEPHRHTTSQSHRHILSHFTIALALTPS